MLALVHPFNPSPDVAHRTPSSSSSRSRPSTHRKSSSSNHSSSSSSSTSTSSLTSASTSRHLPPSTTTSTRHAPPPLPPLRRQASRHPSPPRAARLPSPQPPAPPSQPSPQAQPSSFDIHSYPSPELLRLLASLLTQIAATNDNLDHASSSSDPFLGQPSSPTAAVDHLPIWNTLTSASRAALSTPSSTLTFHARNIPTITLEAYLLRILKYCPTTNEVFLSLLVYFDRMSKLSADATGRSFVIDSYNIHRLVIAGVTVASKFFSDVFYTNSRYAKVGGLPLAELNQLELQFLLLNDFRLVIPGDEMQRYAEQLIIFSSDSSPPPSSSSPSPAAVPTHAMGAIDAFGARVHDHPQATASYHRHGAPESEEEPETETETETETDGGWTTDDEPTIRPAHSTAGSEDSRSICSAQEDDTGDTEMDTTIGEKTPEHIAKGEDGERTPDRHFRKVPADEIMASP
ncbi:cyclin-domain-containing protein [Armillaria luteobubalina]|uniref:Cyclin-domain-containing protein n=1 Tax=Armillaria luteobubalina TaxID=153913 RepID=A0AA39UQI2_9AGAR|nr:cyclin-domain-containing protein [Armillaria luteobubalina]